MATYIEVIEAQTLGAGVSTITFSSIPATYKSLMVLFKHRSTGSSSGNLVVAQFNNDTATNYRNYRMGTDGSSFLTSTTLTSYVPVAWSQWSGSTADTWGDAQFLISNYTTSFVKKGMAYSGANNNATLGYVGINNIRWNGTAAITEIDIFEQASVNFEAGTQAILYGISV